MISRTGANGESERGILLASQGVNLFEMLIFHESMISIDSRDGFG